jgi:hypothetical protein
VVEGARARGPQERFQFREGHLDWIEVRAVGRQESEARSHSFDRGAHLRLFVDGEIVQHDDIAGPERWGEDLLHVGAKAGAVDRPIEHGRCRETGRAQRGDDRVRLPMAAGRVITQPQAAQTSAIAAQQIGCDAAFIQEDVVPGVVQRQPLAPAAPLSGDVGAPLFVGVQRFF